MRRQHTFRDLGGRADRAAAAARSSVEDTLARQSRQHPRLERVIRKAARTTTSPTLRRISRRARRNRAAVAAGLVAGISTAAAVAIAVAHHRSGTDA